MISKIVPSKVAAWNAANGPEVLPAYNAAEAVDGSILSR